jgi:hypothetical protein
MLIDADKEELAAMFSEMFNKELPGFTSIMDFNTWVNEVDVEGWYPPELRSKHSTIVRNALTGRKDKSLENEANKFLKEYGVLWNTGDHENQNVVTRSLLLEYEDHPYGALIIDKVDKQLKQLRPRVGKYFERDQTLAEESAQRDKDSAALTQEKWDVQKDVATQKTATEGISRAGAYRLFEYMKEPEDAPGIGEGLDFDEARAKVVKEMEGTNWDIKVFEDVVKSLREDEAPGTKPVYDPETDSTIFATDEEIAANDSLVPPGQESNLEKDYAQVGRWMVRNGALPVEVWNRYRMGGQNKLDESLDSADQELLYAWIDEVEKRRAKAAAGVNINYQMLNPNASGQAAGQTDDGITGVRVKK